MNLIYQKSKFLVFTICFLTILLSPLIAFGAIDPIINAGLNVTLGSEGDEITEMQSYTRMTAGLGRAMNFFFSIIGVVFFIVIIFGGLRWMTAGGSEEKVATGKKFIIGGIEGMIITFLSYTFIYLILIALRAATSDT